MRQMPGSSSGGLSCFGLRTSAAGLGAGVAGRETVLTGGADGSEGAGVAVAVGTGLGAGRAGAGCVGPPTGFAEAGGGTVGFGAAPPAGFAEAIGGSVRAPPPAGLADVMGGRVLLGVSFVPSSEVFFTSFSSAISIPLRDVRCERSLDNVMMFVMKKKSVRRNRVVCRLQNCGSEKQKNSQHELRKISVFFYAAWSIAYGGVYNNSIRTQIQYSVPLK